MELFDYVHYMYLKFGGHGIFGFSDFASLFCIQIILVHGHQKI